MINAEVGDTLFCITPPETGRERYTTMGTVRPKPREGRIQSGVVAKVTDEDIILIFQVDVPLTRVFRRSDGMSSDGLGVFIVLPG